MADAYLGEIRMFAGSYVPADWALCDGSTLPTAQYEALFSLIGTTYGGSQTNFALPNLMGRLPIGCGQGPALPNYALAATGGADEVTVTPAEMPTHTHQVYASGSAPNTGTPGPTVAFASVKDPARLYLNISGAKTGDPVAFNPAAISTYPGGAQPHQNIMPSTPLKYIICTVGLYPDLQ